MTKEYYTILNQYTDSKFVQNFCTNETKTEHRPITKMIISQNGHMSLKDDTRTVISHYCAGI